MTRSRIEREVGDLADLPREGLIARWRSLYRTAPPKGISRALLLRAVAYGLQARHYGGLKPSLRRQLQKTPNDGPPAREPRARRPARVAPGTRLLRDWNGVTHVVEVADDGVVWNGERYRSLSAVARAITGARWSGPRFFGLTSRDAP